MSVTTAPVTAISRGSLHDGPGVRTVIYFKGCPLRCAWCHNPETQTVKKEILYTSSKCIHCARCTETCPEHHRIIHGQLEYIRDGCTACGKCAVCCPASALTLCGEDKTVGDLWREIEKDAHFYKMSGGGVTFSGGECLLYPETVRETAQLCRNNGIHTALETALYVPWENIGGVAEYIDLFYTDLKIPDTEKHKRYTGHGNEKIIENLRRLSREHDNIILRIPVIPGVNDGEDDFRQFAEMIHSLGPGVKKTELLRYNHLAESKYTLAGKTYTKFADDTQSREQMEKLRTFLAENTARECFYV